MIDITKGRIIQTTLGIESYGILSCTLKIQDERTTQGFGGYALDEPHSKREIGKHRDRVGTDYGMEFINRILITLRLGIWESLPGTLLRIKRDSPRIRIIAIGHIFENRWFEPEVDLTDFLEVK